MFRLAYLYALATALLAPMTTAAQPAVEVSFDLQPRILRVGESAVATFTIKGEQNPPRPSLAPVPELQVQYVGTERSMSFGTAGQSQSVNFRYRVSARRQGTYTLQPPPYSIGGQTYSFPAVELKVVPPNRPAPEQQALKDLLFARITAKEGVLYSQEVFDLTLEIYYRNLNMGRQVQLLNLPQTGFTLNTFQELPARREVVNQQVYEVLRYRAKVQALTAGTFEFDPVVRVAVVVPRQERTRRRSLFDDPFFESFFGRTQQKQVEITLPKQVLEVQPLPEQGRPEDFTGAVGQFRCSFSASPTTLRVGDPITIRTTIQGQGNIDALTPPAFPELDDFKAYDPKLVSRNVDAASASGVKAFEQVVIPRSEERDALPPLVFSYFDPQEEAYKTVRQDPIPLELSPAPAGSALTLAEAGRASQARDELGRDIVYLKDAPEAWPREGEAPWPTGPAFLFVQGVPPVALVLLFLFMRYRESLAADVAKARRLKAPKAARSYLAAAEKALREGHLEETADALWNAVTGYFGNRMNLPPGDINVHAITDELVAKGLPEDAARCLRDVAALCERVRYGQGAAIDPAAMPGQVEDVKRALKEADRVKR